MSLPATRLYDATEATWPPARRWSLGAVTLRDGQGGGQRVSAATALGDVSEDEITAAEAAMRAEGRAPLFQIRDNAALDAQLAARGYRVKDTTVLYSLPIGQLTDRPIPRVTAFEIWEPLAIMTEIWATDGIGPARRAVMARAAQKTSVLARWNEKPAGAAFVGIDAEVAMVHALVVLAHQRRQGVAEWMMRRAALWAEPLGAQHMAVLCVDSNGPANALYQSLGFETVGRYHYRTLPA